MTTTPDFRELCADLVDKLDELNCNFIIPNQSALIKRANDALATPPPEPPTDNRLNAPWNCCGNHDEGGGHSGNISQFARASFEMWGARDPTRQLREGQPKLLP